MSCVADDLSVAGERVRLVAENGARLGVIRTTDGVRIGEVMLSGDCTELVIDRLCIDTEHRSYGAGSETANLVIAAASKAGVDRLRAWAHPNLGLSVYFWTRMGFRPRHGEGPQGGIWFEREV